MVLDVSLIIRLIRENRTDYCWKITICMNELLSL